MVSIFTLRLKHYKNFFYNTNPIKSSPTKSENINPLKIKKGMLLTMENQLYSTTYYKTVKLQKSLANLYPNHFGAENSNGELLLSTAS